MSSLSYDSLAELVSRLLAATRSFAYTANFSLEGNQLSPPAIAEELRAREVLPLEVEGQGRFGEALLASIPLEDRARRTTTWEAARLAGTRTVQVKFRSVDAQGRAHWLHEEAILEHGTIVGVFSVLPVAGEAMLQLAEAPPAPRPRLLKRATTAVRISELEEGLTQNQFTLAYQFQLQPKQHLISGAEVFVRWRHPELGLLFPSRFLPQAEESGFIHQLGQWMVKTACSQQDAWEQAGYSIPLSLNLSSRQVLQPDFAAQLPGEKLRFELTEATLLQQGEQLRGGLKSLHECGFTLGLDNMGLAPLTTEILAQYPITYLKIARSLVQNLETPECLQKALRVIALGDSLGLEVIADGVETNQQAQQLQDSGCSTLQGYLYSRPISAEAMDEVFSSGSYRLPLLAPRKVAA